MDQRVVSREILFAFGIEQNWHDLRPLSHPWGVTNTFCIKGEIVLRRWKSERINRMKNEILVLEHLARTRVKNVEKLKKTIYGSYFYMDSRGDGWTGYACIDGTHPMLADMQAGQVAGSLLGNLHAANREIGAFATSASDRLFHLPDVIERMLDDQTDNSITIRRLGRGVSDLIQPRFEALLSLPEALIHGDFVLENVLVGTDVRSLIDFEFSRVDKRLFDFGAAVAPMRTNSGDFQMASRTFLKGLISAYSLSGNPLSASELELLPSMAAAHYSFVFDDLRRIGHAFSESALAPLEFVLGGEIDWVGSKEFLAEQAMSDEMKRWEA